MAVNTNTIIVPAHTIVSRDASVSGPVDPTYLAAWLCDGSSARGILGTSGSGSYACTFTRSQFCNFAALINSNVTVNASVTGGLTATIPANSVRAEDGIVANPFWFGADVAGVSGVTLGISGNPKTLKIGEFVVGYGYQLERNQEPGATRNYWGSSVPRSDDIDFLPNYDLNGYGREFDGTFTVKEDQRDLFESMWRAQRNFSRYCVIVPEADKNDAWWGKMTAFSWSRQGPGWIRTRLQFREAAMSRRD